jgi:hypothetical protein
MLPYFVPSESQKELGLQIYTTILTEVFATLTEVFAILTEVFPCFFLSCKANARV